MTASEDRTTADSTAAPPASPDGLSSADAARQLLQDGPNELPAPERRNFRRIFFEVVRQPMFVLLIGGGVVYLLLGDRIEAILLLLFASLSVTITLVQESRSEHVLEALRDLASPRALVIRDGQRLHVAGREVVRGDLLVVNEGDRIAADATLLSAQDLLLDESLLTGESLPVAKRAAPGELQLFAGTLVVRGTGVARVHATGLRSEMGKIGKALRGIETEQPHLQKQMARFVRTFAIVGAIAGLLTVLLFGLLRGSWLEALLGGIAIGMSLLPEEFPLVLAVFMAMGAWRISRARVLTRRAAAIETLGATTVLCTDKTGTLTENRMTVVALVAEACEWRRDLGGAPDAATREILDAAQLASAQVATDPMELAIAALANDGRLADPAALTTAQAVLHNYPLRPDCFAMANLYWTPAHTEIVGFAKGAPEAIAGLCALAPERATRLLAQTEALAASGMRVLGVARVQPLAAADANHLPTQINDLKFDYLGLIAFADPLRANAAAAVAECRAAGIRVLMITGDYPSTALAIGAQAGLDANAVLTGAELAALTDAELAERMKTVAIYARVKPEQKLRLVECLKANGEVVAMTGDGVNDAPAIKAAHIGIAMGGRGTDVAREASAIVLLDDDFSSIVKTIRLGRRIYDNLRKAIEYIVAVHIPIAGLAVLPLTLDLPLILTPIHIAFLEMVIDPACSVVLEAEAEEDDVMRRPPRDPSSSILLRERIVWAVLQGVIVFAILGGLLVSANSMGVAEADLRALVFTALVLMNMGLILVNRSFSASLVRAFLRPNRALWILFASVSVVLAIAVLWPPAQTLFRFGRPHWDDFVVAAGAGMASLLLLEALKSVWFRTTPSAPLRS